MTGNRTYDARLRGGLPPLPAATVGGATGGIGPVCRAAVGARLPIRLLYSSRIPDDVIYAAELAQLGAAGTGLEIVYTFTRAQAPRLDRLCPAHRRAHAG